MISDFYLITVAQWIEHQTTNSLSGVRTHPRVTIRLFLRCCRLAWKPVVSPLLGLHILIVSQIRDPEPPFHQRLESLSTFQTTVPSIQPVMQVKPVNPTNQDQPVHSEPVNPAILTSLASTTSNFIQSSLRIPLVQSV